MNDTDYKNTNSSDLQPILKAKHKNITIISVVAGILTYFGLNWLFGGSFADIFYDKDEIFIRLFLYITSAMLSALVAQLVRYDYDADKVNFNPLIGGIGLFIIAYILIHILGTAKTINIFHVINIVLIIYFADFKYIIALFFSWLFLPPVFFFIAKKRGIPTKWKRLVLSLISPMSLILYLILYFLIMFPVDSKFEAYMLRMLRNKSKIENEIHNNITSNYTIYRLYR